jgi:hypothetical protein
MAAMTRPRRRPSGERPIADRARRPSWAEGQSPRTWLAAGAVALIALFWACRGAPLGVPVADDYAFLYRLRFQHPLDWFDSMGAAYYWRPLSRQAYFSLIGPHLVEAPWIAVAIEASLFAVLFVVLYRIARRMAPPPAAAAIAAFPLLSESARVLLGWPSGAQHLMAMVLVALSVHEALAGRLATAGLSAAAGMLAHDSAAIVLPFLPALAWWRTRRAGDALKVLGVVAAVAALWAFGYTIARAHGVQFPPGGGGAFSRLPDLFRRALTAQLNLEDLDEFRRPPVLVAYGLVAIWAAFAFARRAARERVQARWAPLAAAGAWFLVGSLPLAVLLPDWNSWRGSVPGLGFAFFATGLLALASSEIALGFTAVRLVALLLAASPDPLVNRDAPKTATDMSFIRIARLQHIVGDTHRALVGRHPTLERGADIRYWWAPTMAEVGFLGPDAVRVWYADSTVTWRGYGGRPGAPGVDAVIEYDLHRQWKVVAIEPEALRLMAEGQFALEAGRFDQVDSLIGAGVVAQKTGAPEFEGAGLLIRASAALARHEVTLADSLCERYVALVGPRSRYYGMKAACFLYAGRLDDAAREVHMCLALDPKDEVGTQVMDALSKARR